MSKDTIFALASGRPPAAIANIRISGPSAHLAGKALAGDLPPARQAAFRTFQSQEAEVLDEGILLRFDGPASATGEDVVELHCHGGKAVVDAILLALGRVPGLRPAQPGEFTRRAFENGRIDLTEAEGLADLLEAETESQRKAALAMAEGGLRRQVEQWQSQALELSARAEAAIDYVDEDGLGDDPILMSDCARMADDLEAWLQRPRAEPLRDGIQVVLAGPPNSGKSSLLNYIVGSEKAIVTSIAGTTRDRIEVPIAIGGVPMVFIDTAGLRAGEDSVEQIGIERAREAAAGADILLWLGEPGEAPKHARVLLVHSRSDDRPRPAEPSVIPVSARTGEGVRVLLDRIQQAALTLLPGEGAIALNRRHADALRDAAAALRDASAVADIVIIAELLRSARQSFDRLTGRAGVEDLLDHLFGRFCLGK